LHPEKSSVRFFLRDSQQLRDIVVGKTWFESHRVGLGAVRTSRRRRHNFLDAKPEGLVNDGFKGQAGAGCSSLGFGRHIRVKRQGGSHEDIMMLFLRKARATLTQNK
jgi:hypothetical protein